MVLVGANDPSVYYKETSEKTRSSRFCLKKVHTTAPRSEKQTDAINVQIGKGKTTTFIHLDEDEAKKVQQHGDMVLKKLQRIHKSVIWNFVVGRSFVDKIQKAKQGAEEINIDHDENLEFDANNPKTWSDESVDFVKSILKANEFAYDGFVVLFCVANDQKDPEVDYDEMAWELEKCLTYHFIATRSQVIMNEEACMSRKGLDPVSRKTKTPGRKKSGFCVYLAYQLLENVSYDQMVGESITKHTDICQKKKQMLGALTGTKLMPQIDERIRKSIKEIREFMTREQLELVLKMKDLKDPQSIDMLVQFLTLLHNGGSKDSSGKGLVGLPQFLSFLNKSQEDSGPPSSQRMSMSSPRVASSTRGSTLPRPSVSGSIRNRKASISSQTVSISSRSTTPDTPRRTSIESAAMMRQSAPSRTQSSLASIPSSGSGSSTPETLRKQEHGPSKPNGKTSQLPKRTSSMGGGHHRPSSAAPTPHAKRSSTRDSHSSRPSSSSVSRERTNGDVSGSSSSRRSGIHSPSVSASNSPRRGSKTHTPPPEGRITREDLRRMNKSYPSQKKSAASFSRASIPM